MNRLLQREIGKLLQTISEFHDSSFNANDDGITEEETELVAAKFIKRMTASVSGERILGYLKEIHPE